MTRLSMTRLWSIVVMEARLFWRTPQAAFWTFFFPAFLLVLLGSVFGQHPGQMAFLIPGLLGMVLASTAYYSVGVVVTHYRSTGFLKRLALVPIPTWQFVAGQMVVRAAVVLLVGVELMAIGAGLFHVRPSTHPLTLAAVLATGIPAFLATGFAVGVLARSVESANSIASFLFFPMTFLSGAYFPIHMLPGVLRPVAGALPLTYFLHGLRAAAGGLGPAAVLTDLAVLSVWGVMGILVAVRRFRWTT